MTIPAQGKRRLAYPIRYAFSPLEESPIRYSFSFLENLDYQLFVYRYALVDVHLKATEHNRD